MSEQLLALEGRKNAMTSYTDDLFLGAQEAYSALWPGQWMPSDPVDLGNDLQLAKVRLREWRDSGARVGADEALSYFLSWYEKADLETLRTVREGSIWTTDPEHIRRRRELAHSYVDYADIDAFVRDIREPEKKEDDIKVAANAECSDSSQDEEEAEEAGTNIRNRDLSRAEVMAPFHLLGPALPKPTSPLLQLHQPAALLLPLLLEICIKTL
jgi:hypothetical protein